MGDKFLSFFSDAAGIIREPGNTLARLMETKKWLPVFLLLVIVMGLFTFITYPIQIKNMVEQAEMSGYFSEGEIPYILSPSAFSRLMVSVFSAIMVILTLIFAAFSVYLFFGIGGAEGVYSNYFSLVVNASIIDMLFPSILRTISLLTGTSITVFSKPLLILVLPRVGSLDALLLSQLDVFDIWYLAAIAAGVGVFSKMSYRKALYIALFYFLFKAIIGVGFGFLGMLLIPQG